MGLGTRAVVRVERIRKDIWMTIQKGNQSTNRSTGSLLQEGLGAMVSNRMINRTTIRSIGSVDSVFVTCFGADLEPRFTIFWGQSLSPVVLV